MNILINGQKADIILENEKTVGDVLAALEQWLAHSGHRLSGMTLDGAAVHTGSLAAAMDTELAAVETLDILTSSLPELKAESLLRLGRDIDEYESLDFGEKQRFAGEWNESPQARLLGEELPAVFELSAKTFSGEGPAPRLLRSLVEEQLRELRDPLGELDRSGPLVAEICRRLTDLPLDIQTGKDSRAAETVRLFSTVTEKVFRIFKVLRSEGVSIETIEVEGAAAADYIAEFDAALKEMTAAYEQRDAVLVGDLAEYELAPRLRVLYTAIGEGMKRLS